MDVSSLRTRSMIFNKEYYDTIWGTIHRHDYCKDLATRLISTYGKVRFLDIGTGCGELVRELRLQGAEAYGVDVSEYAVANSHGNVLLGDIRSIPFPDNYFDVVHSQGVWGYFPKEDVQKAWSECLRVGKKQHHNIDYNDSDPNHQYLFWESKEWWDEQLKLPAMTLIKAHSQINQEYVNDELDKDTAHSYLSIYHNRFGSRTKFTLLEIGVSAQSLLLWKRAFPQARIIGIDKQQIEFVPEGTEFYQIDVKDALSVLGDTKLDVIIDDGSHIIEEQLASLKLLYPRLNDDGFYFIEDIQDIDADKSNFQSGIVHDMRQERNRWDNVLVEFTQVPKVLVTCPTHQVKEYSMQRWIDNVKNLTYLNYDILVVDNSPDESFMNKYQDQIPMLHIEAPQDPQQAGIRICKSMAEVQKHFLAGNYTHWMNIEADNIPPKDIIERLMNFQPADWVSHCYPSLPNQPGMQQGIGCSLLSRRLMTDFDWSKADDSPDSELWNFAQPVRNNPKYQTVELWGLFTVEHLK